MKSYAKMKNYFTILLFFGIVLGQAKTSPIIENKSNKKSPLVFIADVLIAYGGFQLAEGLTYNSPSEGASYTFKQKEFIDWYDDEYESANEKAKLGATLIGVGGVIRALDYILHLANSVPK